MLLAAITLAEAGVTRWTVPPTNVAECETVAFWMTCAFVAPLVAWDLASRRRLHPATLWGGLAFLVSGPLRDAATDRPAWRAASQWAVSLLG